MTGTPELIIVVLIVLLLFGSTWLPKLARRAGKSTVEFNKARQELEATRDQLKDTTAPITDTVTKINKTISTSPSQLAKNALLGEGAAAAAQQLPAGASGPEIADEILIAEQAQLDENQTSSEPSKKTGGETGGETAEEIGD